MQENRRQLLQFVTAIALAIAIAFALVATRPELQHEAEELPTRTVEVINAEEIAFSTQVTAYGIVEPAITLNSMAELSGKITYLHPDLKAGSTVPADTVVVRIDSEDYDVALKQAQADLRANQASLQELETEEASARRALTLAQQNLEVGEAEYERIEAVYEQQVVTRSALDAEEQKVIALRQSVEDIQGRINGFESRSQSMNSQIARAEQAVKNAQAVLARTEISLPFDARIGTVAVDTGEFVATGSLLFEAIDLNGVEIDAQIPMDTMNNLVRHLFESDEAVIVSDRLIQTGGRVNEVLGLETRVRLVNSMSSASWEARLLRISDAIDATRQTLGVVVGVENPYEQVIPGRRPPLVKGMYTAIDFIAPARPSLVVPRRAVHQGRVYLADSNDHLRIRSVEVALKQSDLVVIENGVEPGERVIITDLVPVIAGMPLRVIHATEFELEMRRRAAGSVAGE